MNKTKFIILIEVYTTIWCSFEPSFSFRSVLRYSVLFTYIYLQSVALVPRQRFGRHSVMLSSHSLICRIVWLIPSTDHELQMVSKQHVNQLEFHVKIVKKLECTMWKPQSLLEQNFYLNFWNKSLCHEWLSSFVCKYLKKYSQKLHWSMLNTKCSHFSASNWPISTKNSFISSNFGIFGWLLPLFQWLDKFIRRHNLVHSPSNAFASIDIHLRSFRRDSTSLCSSSFLR